MCLKMANNGTRYNEEFKKTIVDLYKSGTSVLNLSKEYGASVPTIYNWIKLYDEHKTSDGEKMTTKEILEMKKEIQKIKRENDILKKTLKILSKD